MKKILIILFMFLIVGCKNKSELICTFDIKNMDNYSLDAKYTITNEGNFVKKIIKEEIYECENEEILKYLYNSKDLEYMNLKDLYGGYNYDLKINNDKVVLNVVINLNDVNLEKMVKDNYIDEDYILSNKLTTSGIKRIYESKGGTCNER